MSNLFRAVTLDAAGRSAVRAHCRLGGGVNRLVNGGIHGADVLGGADRDGVNRLLNFRRAHLVRGRGLCGFHVCARFSADLLDNCHQLLGTEFADTEFGSNRHYQH